MNIRKILLVSMDYIRPKDPSLPLGLASIIANLQSHGIDHELLTYNVKNNIEMDSIVSDIMESNATDVMLGAFIWNEHYVQHIMNLVSPHKKIIIGGPQVSYVSPGNLEKYYPKASAFIRGYAEQAVVEYARGKEFPGIHQAYTKDLGLQAKADISSLPSPLLKNIIQPKTFVRWETQRGCAYACSFCQHRDPDNRGVHSMDTNRINNEANWLRENNIPDIAILDPTFNTNTLHAIDVLSKLPQDSEVSLQIRPEKLNKVFLQACAESPARVTLEMGVQTLESQELETIDRIKGANSERLVNKVKEKLLLAESYGINSMITLMYGLPHQTLQSFTKTLDWCRNKTTARVVSYPLMLLRGTPLYDKKKDLGLLEAVRHFEIEDSDRISHHIPHVIQSPTMSEDDWWKMGEISKN